MHLRIWHAVTTNAENHKARDLGSHAVGKPFSGPPSFRRNSQPGRLLVRLLVKPSLPKSRCRRSSLRIWSLPSRFIPILFSVNRWWPALTRLARLNEDIRGTTELGDVFLEQQAPSWHGCSVCGRVLRLSANSTQQIRKQSPRRPNMGRALDCDFILPPYLGHEIPRDCISIDPRLPDEPGFSRSRLMKHAVETFSCAGAAVEWLLADAVSQTMRNL